MFQLPPSPVAEIAIEPRNGSDVSRLEAALHDIAKEDPVLRFSVDRESGQVIGRGVSERHLARVVEGLRSKFALEINVGDPQVSYRETIARIAESDHVLAKYRQFARVRIRFEPIHPQSGFEFENAVVDGSVPLEYLPGIVGGLSTAKEQGVIAGFPVVGVRATLVDGAHHEVDSSIVSFDAAARACFREAMVKAGPKLLEPVMRVEVVTPEMWVDLIIADLVSRGGRIAKVYDRSEGRRAIGAMSPLAGMLGYAKALRLGGRHGCSVNMLFDHYEPVPKALPDDEPFPPAVGMPA